MAAVEVGMTKRVMIVGHGYVGKAYLRLFGRAHVVVAHDPPQGLTVPWAVQETCDLAVICVPTPRGEDGACDTGIVEDAIRQLPLQIPLVLIKSTVPPGTTERLNRDLPQAGGRIVFSPEYIGEGGYHVPPQFPDPHDAVGHGFVVVGGEAAPSAKIIDMLMPIMGPATRYRMVSATEAELVKYFENAFLALKVTYANEMRAVCESLGVRYHVVREGWLDDPRVGGSHSAAFAHRPGFDGKCLPKDTAALEAFCRSRHIPTPLLSALIKANRRDL
jgi:UDPglucose 6-dehydrogenase